MKRRHRHALAKADAGQIDVFYILGVDQDARAFARQIHPGFHPQAEGPQVFIEGFRAHPQRQRHEGGVAAVGQRGGQVLVSVAVFPAADAVAVHGDGTGAGEPVGEGGRAAVQGGGAGEHFKGGAGLVHIGNDGDAHQLPQRFDVVPGRVVGVVVGLHAHGQYGPGVHVHHHALNARRVIDLDALPHGPLHHALDGAVHGEPQGKARLGRGIGRLAVGQKPRPGVYLRAEGTGLAAQQRFIQAFQPALAHGVHVGQAQNLAQQFPLRIHPFGVFVK